MDASGLDMASLDALVKLECLQGLPAMVQAEVAVRARVASFSPNDTILAADERVDKIYLVSEGSARVLLAGRHPLSCLL